MMGEMSLYDWDEMKRRRMIRTRLTE